MLIVENNSKTKMKSFKLMILLWALAIAGVILVNATFGDYSTVFMGIAESDELEVSYPSPVEIRDISVVPGQEVYEGELLIIVESPELDTRIETVGFQLEEIKARVNISAKETIAQIEQIESQTATKVIDINSQIAQLDAQFQLNKDLTTGLKSINSNQAISDNQNPIKMRILSLKEELSLYQESANTRISQLKAGLNSEQNPYEVQVKNLVDELRSLNNEKQKLTSYATISGVIGSINFAKGEKVSPYSPILAIYSKSPSFVKGYLHESVSQNINIGDQLEVQSQQNSNSVSGTVIGVGSRIIEFPLRLRKNPDVAIWGREVQINIPGDNGFLLGEKVIIRMNENQLM